MNASGISFEKLLDLITQQKFGYFVLSSPSGAERYGSSVEVEEGNEKNAKALTPEQLQACLQELIGTYGAGNYSIKFRKTPKSQATSEVSTRFFVLPEKTEEKKQEPINIGMTGIEAIDTRVAKATAEVMQNMYKEFEMKQKIADLERQLAEAKQNKPKRKEDRIKEFVQLGTIVATALTSKLAPEALPSINKFFETMSGKDEGEEGLETEKKSSNEPTITVTRTD